MELELSRQLENIIRQITRNEIDMKDAGYNVRNVTRGYKLNVFTAPTKNIANNIGWLKPEPVFKRLYDQLLSNGFIACTCESFKKHFLGTGEPSEKLIWHTETKLLVYLFDQLTLGKFIPKHRNFHLLLSNHFLDVRNRILKNGTLRSSLNQVRNNKRILIIESIVNELERI
jgi:hypothetical protein